MPKEDELLFLIKKTQERHHKNQEFRKIAKRQAKGESELQSKVRAMAIAFEATTEQNSELLRIQKHYFSILQEKDKQLELKEIQNKKYREQLLEAMGKNQEMTIYCRQLANQYTILLQSMKDSEQTSMMRQQSAQSKIFNMENQVSHLRKNILGIKDSNDSEFQEKSRKIRDEFVKNNPETVIKLRSNSSKKRKSLNTPKKHQKTQQSSKSKKSLVHLLA